MFNFAPIMSKKKEKPEGKYEDLLNNGWLEYAHKRNGCSILINKLETDIFVMEHANPHWATEEEITIINQTIKQWQDKPVSTLSETS